MKPQNVTCPECGGAMESRVQRATGRRFWGCTGYPNCRGTRNTDGDAPHEAAEASRRWDEEADEAPRLDEPWWRRP